MTLRDWFAGQVMCGLYSDNAHVALFGRVADRRGISSAKAMAIAAYEMADALIAERNRIDVEGGAK